MKILNVTEVAPGSKLWIRSDDETLVWEEATVISQADSVLTLKNERTGASTTLDLGFNAAHTPFGPPPHLSSHRCPLSEHVTCMAGFQPEKVHWKQVCAQLPVQVSEHGVSLTPSMAYGVPRRSTTASPSLE